MQGKIIVTISREYGSGGRRIGRQVAQKLGIAFYDSNILRMAAEESGLSLEFVEDHDQKIQNSFLFNIAVSGYYSGSVFNRETLLPEDKLFLAQTKLIRELAEKESCVIVGRCADYILREREDCINVFLYSDVKNRVKRAIREYQIPQERAEAALHREDKARSNHYNHYTGQAWGDIHNYHLAANTDYFGGDYVAEMIVRLAQAKGFHPDSTM